MHRAAFNCWVLVTVGSLLAAWNHYDWFGHREEERWGVFMIASYLGVLGSATVTILIRYLRGVALGLLLNLSSLVLAVFVAFEALPLFACFGCKAGPGTFYGVLLIFGIAIYSFVLGITIMYKGSPWGKH
jgi:hypothetical protein